MCYNQPMIFRLILLFTLLPMLELYVLLMLAEQTSALLTFGLVLITGVIGAITAKSQGRSVYRTFQNDMREGRMPQDSIIEGLCVLVGGALLLTPGLITDIAGFMLVLPPTRILLRENIKKHAARSIHVHVYNDPFNTIQQ